MAAMTLAEARTRVAGLLDDADGDRWGTTELDQALRTSLSKLFSAYVTEGGGRFSQLVSASTTGSSNEVDLSSYDPMDIDAVALVTSGERRDPIQRTEVSRTGMNAGAESLEISLTATPTFPTDGAHPLVGSGATALRTWDAFDDAVCLGAAVLLLPKDGERNNPLREMHVEGVQAVLRRQNTATVRGWPAKNHTRANRYRWSYEESTQVLRLHASYRGYW